MHITIVAGARPNFMKIAPIIHEIIKRRDAGVNIQYKLVHTGQHYDEKLSGFFFTELNIPSPDVNLEVGSGSAAEQTAGIMVGFERYLIQNPTDLVLVVGDVTSTMACAVVSKKLGVQLAHVEAGIRSFDDTMPEEINRKVTDSITDYFFTTSDTAGKNLQNEGVSANKIYFVGNVMIDSLLHNLHRLKKPAIFDQLQLNPNEYLVLTLHRPANVDEPHKLAQILMEIDTHCEGNSVVFPVHPRTKKNLENLTLNHIHFIEPLSYLEFNFLVKNSKAVLTDSGGITEETTVLGIPCLTLRDNTERPETCTVGTNELIGTDPSAIPAYLKKLFANEWKKGYIPELWDGKAAERIVFHIETVLNGR